ncbi:MAG: SoxR reducing system RseC family protein [Spirochaetaceae bacterium]|nr:SoxR reducing system RseC family protein [Spirochaetaceae bacterium]
MYDRGTVTAVDKNIITVTCGDTSHCKTCPASRFFCKASEKGREFKALNTDNLDLREGDNVEVFISPSKTIGYSFSILIFPLLMFLAGYYLTANLTNTLSDGIKLLGGFAGLVIGFAIAFLYSSFTRKQQYPLITKKIDFDTE